MYKPNLNMPLAIPYNERGVAGFTHTQTNSEDQRKINCLYEVTKNPLTGQGKLTLTKRHGVTTSANTYGSMSQAAYVVIVGNAASIIGPDDGSGGKVQVFSTLDPVTRVSDSNTTVSIFSLSSGQAYIPIYVDKTIITNIETTVVQTTPGAAIATFPPVQLKQRVAFNSSSIAAAWTEIVDADFTALNHRGKMEHMDGYAFILESTNKIYNSDLNSLSSWNPTNFISKQIKQDYPQGLARLNNQIIAFGEEYVEMFYNAGNSTGSPLSPIRQLHQKIGLVFPGGLLGCGTQYYCQVENRLYFVGRKAGGTYSVGVFSYNGSVFTKVSTSYIDKILNENTYYATTSFGFHGQSAIAISLTHATAATSRWLMFFPEWNEWFEWNSTIFTPLNSGEFFIGTAANRNKVYTFGSGDNWQDNGTNFTMQTQFKLPQDGHQRKRMAEFGVLADTARATNMLSVEFSDDDYVSFINIGAIDLARDIKTLNRGGSYRQRAVRLSSTNALEARLHAFISRIE